MDWTFSEKLPSPQKAGRVIAQPLQDQTAIAACLDYLDLSPIRTKVASSLEESDITSPQSRIIERQVAVEVTTPDPRDVRTEHGPQAGRLASIALAVPRQKVREKVTSRRASNKVCLPMTLEGYLLLLNWTGRKLHRTKRGQIPAECAPRLEHLEFSAETWLDFVQKFQLRFRNEAVRSSSRQAYLNRTRSAQTSPQSI